MRVHVLYFQNVRKITGSPGETIELETEADIGDLAEALISRYPALREALPSLLFAVNETHAGRNDPLGEGDTVAVMPPFSGG